jgi:hypothetical protein
MSLWLKENKESESEKNLNLDMEFGEDHLRHTLYSNENKDVMRP